jgi:formylglycine-generating enzyme required for sulfatase activity
MTYTGSSHARRGGAWQDHTRFSRMAYRSFSGPSFLYFSLGFRLSRRDA